MKIKKSKSDFNLKDNNKHEQTNIKKQTNKYIFQKLNHSNSKFIMNNHLIKIVLQSIWSSLTGGWFYDPHLSLFINTVHMYIWIFLFMLPFSFYIVIYQFSLKFLFNILIIYFKIAVSIKFYYMVKLYWNNFNIFYCFKNNKL